jgi:hypothetical protein
MVEPELGEDPSYCSSLRGSTDVKTIGIVGGHRLAQFDRLLQDHQRTGRAAVG